MAYNLERRQSPRKRFDHLLYVEVEPGNGGMVLNFSEHGFGFRAVKRVRPKEEVKFAFNLADQRRLEGRGRLEWADKEGRVAGLQFTEVSEEFRSEMRKWLSGSAEYTSKPAKDSGASLSNGEYSSAESMSGSLTARRREALGKAAPFKGGRSLSLVPPHSVPTNPVPLAESDIENDSIPEDMGAQDAVELPWAAALPPALGADRKPAIPRSSQAKEFAAATAFKLNSFDPASTESTDIAEEPSATEEVGEPVVAEGTRGARSVQGAQAQSEHIGASTSSAAGGEIAALEARVAGTLNEHAQALLQHFQHEEQRLMAGFRDSAARVLRDSERQLFPIREAVQAQMKSLESSVASAAASAKVLDQYPALLERAQQQALDRFQAQIQEVLHAHVMELRRRSETVLEEVNVRVRNSALLPRRIRTSSGIVVTGLIVMLLALLFAFRREAAGALVWLGEQMVEPTTASEPANTAAPTSKVAGSATGSKAKDEPLLTTPTEALAAPTEIRQTASTPKNVRALWDLVAKGDVSAQLTLGNMYLNGRGVTKNCSQARRLFAAAAKKGNDEAKQKLAELDRGACA
ncbi:MAG: PilZ domain-containing protein [Acidobacteriota bacterium]|nr:PilZ domain-containing protein [Acidobacteriota bacterium]